MPIDFLRWCGAPLIGLAIFEEIPDIFTMASPVRYFGYRSGSTWRERRANRQSDMQGRGGYVPPRADTMQHFEGGSWINRKRELKSR